MPPLPPPTTRGRAKSRLWANDEELAKKDDDLTDPRLLRHGNQWQTAGRIPRPRPIARFAAYAVIAFLLILGFSKLFSGRADPSLQRPYVDQHLAIEIPAHDGSKEPTTPDSRVRGSDGRGALPEPAKTYSGPLKLPALGQSLHAIGSTGGKQSKNRNVLFAAASLKSATTLLPFACKMAYEHVNYVHFALLGRSEISLLELIKINGIDNSCPLILHGAIHEPHFAQSCTGIFQGRRE
jgi:hypothetical protein